MIKKIKEFIKHPLISGSGIVVIGTFFINVINYVFTLAMIRLLSESDYGLFASLVSLINITFVFSTTIVIVFTKFTATFSAQKEDVLIGKLLKKGILWVGILSFVLAAISVAASPLVGEYLDVKNLFLIDLVIFSMVVYFVASVPTGILQGLLKFLSSMIVGVSSTALKLISGVFLVYFLSFNVAGGLIAFLLAGIAGLLMSVWILRKYLKIKSQQALHAGAKIRREIVSYSIPVFFSSFSFTAFNSVDILFVRHYFSNDISGQYAVLSLMGRSIFFVVAPISSVLLPIVAQKKEKKESVFSTLLLAIVIVLIPCVLLTIIYFAIPQLILSILLQSKAPTYFPIAKDMGMFALFTTLYSLASLLNSYYFSIGKTIVSYFALVAIILEVIYIYFFHNSIHQIILGLIMVSLLLLISLLVYYPYASRQR